MDRVVSEMRFVVEVGQAPTLRDDMLLVRIGGRAEIEFPQEPETCVVRAGAARVVPKAEIDLGYTDIGDHAIATATVDCMKDLLRQARDLWTQYNEAVDRQRTEAEWGRL